MKQEITETMEIPEGIEINVDDSLISAKKNGKKTNLRFKKINIEKEGNILKLFIKKGNKGDKRQIKTMIAHIKNIFRGFKEPFVYRLQIASIHFPMNVTYDNAKKEILIKNFLGEKTVRKAKIENDVDVKIEKDIIVLTSYNKESAGQSAANIERATKIKSRDRRVFQDGCYIISKSGKEL